MCQSVALPLPSPEYWPIGDTTIRFANVTPFMVYALNSLDMIVPSHFCWMCRLLACIAYVLSLPASAIVAISAGKQSPAPKVLIALKMECVASPRTGWVSDANFFCI